MTTEQAKEKQGQWLARKLVNRINRACDGYPLAIVIGVLESMAKNATSQAEVLSPPE